MGVELHRHPGLLQGLEPALVQVLIAELPVEALDVAVLHRAPRLDQDVANAMGLCPSHECPAGELRAVVGGRIQLVVATPSTRRYLWDDQLDG